MPAISPSSITSSAPMPVVERLRVSSFDQFVVAVDQRRRDVLQLRACDLANRSMSALALIRPLDELLNLLRG